MRIYSWMDTIMCWSKKSAVVKHSAASGGFHSGKKASKQTIMHMCKNIFVFMCFYKKLINTYCITFAQGQ